MPAGPQGWVDVYKNAPTGTPVYTFKGDNDFDGTGMYIVDAGALSDFLFVDQVSAADKPTGSPGTPTDNGILVKASTGSGGHLKIDTQADDWDIRLTQSTSNSATVQVKDTSNNIAQSRFGAGVNKLTIQTHPQRNPTDPLLPTVVNVGSTDTPFQFELPGLAAETSLRIESLGQYDIIKLGGSLNAEVNDVVVRTGKGNNIVQLQHWGSGTTTALVDFDPALGRLGSANFLRIGPKSSHNCIATLANAPGTADHRIEVDEILVDPPAANPTGAFAPLLLVEKQTAISFLTVYGDGHTVGLIPEVHVDAAPVTGQHTLTVTTEVFLGGIMTFAEGSGPSLVNKFLRFDDLPTDVVNVEAAAAVTVLKSSTISTLNIPTTGKLTMEPHLGTSDPTRVLLVNSLFMGNDPMSPDGVLDLTDNAMIVDYTGSSPHDYIRPLITTAYNDPAEPDYWTGNGLGSSSAVDAASTNDKTGLGYSEATNLFSSFPSTWENRSVDSTSLLVKYTLYGDADLNGTVNLADFNRLAANFGTQTGAVWYQGDFTYDGAVNLADFNRQAANFGKTLGGGGGEEFQSYTYEDLLAILMKIYPELF